MLVTDAQHIFDCLNLVSVVQLVIENLKTFNEEISTEKPLFQVETLLAAPDVVLHPGANDVYKFTLTCVRDCIEGYVYSETAPMLISNGDFISSAMAYLVAIRGKE